MGPVKEKVRKGVGVDIDKFNRVLNENKKDYLNRGGKIKDSIGVNNRSSFVDYMERTILGSRFKDKHGTRLKYLTVLKKLKSYLKDRSRTDLSFYDLDVDFLYDFQSYMLDTGMTQNSTTHYLKIIQSFVRRSFTDREVLNTNDPFLNFKFEKKEVKLKETLNQKEIRILRNQKIRDPKLNMVRTMFLFQFFTGGMRVSDLLTLRFRNLINGRLNYRMFKTNYLVDFELTETLLDLIAILISYKPEEKPLLKDEYQLGKKLKKRRQKSIEEYESKRFSSLRVKSSLAIPPEITFVDDFDLHWVLIRPPSIVSYLGSLSERELKQKLDTVNRYIENKGRYRFSTRGTLITSGFEEKRPTMEKLREEIQNQLEERHKQYYQDLIDKLTQLGTDRGTQNDFVCGRLSNEEFSDHSNKEDFNHIPDQLYKRINKSSIVYNRDLKKLQEHLGLKKTLKSHLPRTSFTNIMMMGNVNHRDISNTLGHSSISVTDEYLKTGFKNDGVDQVIKRTSESFGEE